MVASADVSFVQSLDNFRDYPLSTDKKRRQVKPEIDFSVEKVWCNVKGDHSL